MRRSGVSSPVAFCLALLAARGEAAAQTADDLFRGDVLHEVRLTLDPADWQRLRANFQENTYYRCELAWGGLSVGDVAIRSRGYGSRSGTKPGLRVDFNRFIETQEFLGLRALVLDNLTQDAAFIKERLVMQLFERLGVPAPRVAHTRLFVNGAYAGLYALVEHVDKRFLARIFGAPGGHVENDGHLYEYRWNYNYYFTHLGGVLSRYAEIFEPRTREEEAPEELFAILELMIGSINFTADAEFEAAVSQFLDLRFLMTYIAVETFVADWDGVLGYWGMNNFYIYRFENRDLFQFIPWDKDYTFKASNTPIFWNADENVLMRRALAVPRLRAAYLEALAAALTFADGKDAEGQPAGEPWLELEIEREYQQIRAAAREDTLKPYSNSEFEAEIAYLRRFARERSDFVRQELGAEPVGPSEPPPGIDLGDIAAGGDGTGTGAPGAVGIHADTGLLVSAHTNAAVDIGDGSALTAVGDTTSTFIDSVFIIDREEMPINTAGVRFAFPPEDVLGRTWDHILRDRIGGEDEAVSIGGVRFERGVGIHAAAGITYDLDRLREAHGPLAVDVATAFAGMGDSPACLAAPGVVTAYLILSDGERILESLSHRASSGARLLELPIPPAARFLTLASGGGNGQFYCNAGTFANAFILAAELSPPRNLAAVAGSERVELAWQEPVAGAEFTHYRVLRGGKPLVDLPETQTAYTDAAVAPGTTHCYTVRSVRGESVSGDSNQACAAPERRAAFVRGDCNGDAAVVGTVTDAIVMLDYSFLGGPTPPCLAACDADGDGAFGGTVTDAVYLLGFNFLGGQPPPPPFPACGPAADEVLGCLAPPAGCP